MGLLLGGANLSVLERLDKPWATARLERPTIIISSLVDMKDPFSIYDFVNKL